MATPRNAKGQFQKGFHYNQKTEFKVGSSGFVGKHKEETKQKMRLAKLGIKGKESNHWKSGKTINTQGYIYLYSPNHPSATKQGYVREHRIIIEKQIGRFLLPSEVVHHVDHNKQNNSIENLLLFANHSEHMKHKHNIK